MPTTYAIPDGRTAFATTLWTGTGATQVINNAVNGVSFQPDFVWAKRRNTSVASHGLVDSVRGTGKTLFSNLTDPEDTGDSNLTAFNSNGFTAGSGGNFNASGPTYVGWQWKGGGTAVSNTSGSITSSVSANTTAGFSVVTYTGTGAAATIGHGLGAVPSMIILFPRNNTGYAQPVWHTSLGGSTDSDYLVISNPGARNYAGALTGLWNSTAPTSSVFSIGASNYSNTSTKNYVAYCFAAVPGYSAFGKYTGNGDPDGPFVYLGFRPRFLLIKNSSVSVDWVIEDTSRDLYNPAGAEIEPNLNNTETTGNADLDILSNGFKPRRNSTFANGSGNTIIYAAFAEVPFKYANAR